MCNQSKARHDTRQQGTIIAYAEESFELVESIPVESLVCNTNIVSL